MLIFDSEPSGEDVEAVVEANKKVMATATILLKGGDKDELAWVRAYYLESIHFLTGGRINEAEARAVFAQLFDGTEARFSMLSQGLVATLVPSLSKARSQQLTNSQRLGRAPRVSFSIKSDVKTRLLTQFQPTTERTLYQAWRNIPLTKPPVAEVFVLRQQAPPVRAQRAKAHAGDHGKKKRSLSATGPWSKPRPPTRAA
ncbi:hypothetical protein LP420_31555 [Massilia sp. B-10]|nr:hypothetical protein LP420_31555 [Massilia sp. B-10]